MRFRTVYSLLISVSVPILADGPSLYAHGSHSHEPENSKSKPDNKKSRTKRPPSKKGFSLDLGLSVSKSFGGNSSGETPGASSSDGEDHSTHHTSLVDSGSVDAGLHGDEDHTGDPGAEDSGEDSKTAGAAFDPLLRQGYSTYSTQLSG